MMLQLTRPVLGMRVLNDFTNRWYKIIDVIHLSPVDFLIEVAEGNENFWVSSKYFLFMKKITTIG